MLVPVRCRVHRDNRRNPQSPRGVVSSRRNTHHRIQAVNQGDGVLVIFGLSSPWEYVQRVIPDVRVFIFQRNKIGIEVK